MSSGEFKCYYGRGTESVVYVHDNWYAVDGSTNVNLAPHDTEWQDGIDVETIADVDCFSWSSPIESHDDLVAAVEDGEEDED